MSAPAMGAARNSQSYAKAQPPTKSVGPALRAGFTETLVAGMPTRWNFTSEVQYWSKYDADTDAVLRFLGDDDVWGFINGVLALDFDGIHVPSTGTVTIDAAAGTCSARSAATTSPRLSSARAAAWAPAATGPNRGCRVLEIR